MEKRFQKYALGIAISLLLLIRFAYVLSFPLNFGRDGSVYYTMLLRNQSHLLMAPGYSYLMKGPYHWMKQWISGSWGTTRDPNWWESDEDWRVGDKVIDSHISWPDVLQDRDFILFQQGIECLSLFLAFLLARRYFGFPISLLFLLLYGISPLSLEEPSSTRPEWLQGALLIMWIYIAEKTLRHKTPILYPVLGALAALTFLVKFNIFPLFLLLFMILLYLNWDSWKKIFLKVSLSLCGGLLTLVLFIFSFHLPTTGTKILNMNRWTLADKCFLCIPDHYLKPSYGIATKRILAILSRLPKEQPLLAGTGPGTYFANIETKGDQLRNSYATELSWLMQAEESALDPLLEKGGCERIDHQIPLLRIAYYVGLEQYKVLLTDLYKELIKKFPFSFIWHSIKGSVKCLILKDKTDFYRPSWQDVQKGRIHPQQTFYGYVSFLWPKEAARCNTCYHKPIIWNPGLWFFTKLKDCWPPLWLLWCFAFFAFFIALKNIKQNRSAQILVSFMALALIFIFFSNFITEYCRLKDYRCIHIFHVFLASVGIYQFGMFLRPIFRKYALNSHP